MINFVSDIQKSIIANFYPIIPYLKTNYSKNDDELNNSFIKVDKDADYLVSFYFPKVVSVLTSIDKINKEKFIRQFQESLGINLFNIIEKENIQKAFDLSVNQNLSLIKSLSDRQLNDFKNIVFSQLRSNEFNASELKSTLVDKFGMTKRHAKLIANDQSHKLTADLTQIRYQNLGIKRYVWSNSKDRRVRGNPEGLYPNAKYNHWDREGKTFCFDKPPPDGNPGQPINCRCIALPIISDIEENTYVKY